MALSAVSVLQYLAIVAGPKSDLEAEQYLVYSTAFSGPDLTADCVPGCK
jgi:hypothetical protein